MAGILDHLGRPWRNGSPPRIDEDIASGSFGREAVPQVLTFQAILGAAWRAFWHGREDEAIRDSRPDAQAMLRDVFLTGLLNERYLAVSSLPWHIEGHDEKDARQVVLKDQVEASLRRVPYFRKLLRALCRAIWHGRYGIQLVPRWEQIKGQRTLTIPRWIPTHGDKIGYQWDGTPYVLVNTAWAEELPQAETLVTTYGRGLLLQGRWRERFVIHTHDVVDGDYFDPESAGAVHGVGIRHWVYWYNWVRMEYAEWISTYLERVGLGLTLWEYDATNPESKSEVEAAAKASGRKTHLLVPTWPDRSSAGGKRGGVERIETPTSGVDALTALQERMEQALERFIVGQSMSGGQDGGDGLGGTGRAKFAQNTKQAIIEDDAESLAETLTGTDEAPGLVRLIQRASRPDLADVPLRFAFDIEQPESEKKVQAGKTLFDMKVPLKADELRGAAGFSKPTEDDETIVQQEEQQAPGPDPAQEAQAQQQELALDQQRHAAELAQKQQQHEQELRHAEEAHGHDMRREATRTQFDQQQQQRQAALDAQAQQRKAALAHQQAQQKATLQAQQAQQRAAQPVQPQQQQQPRQAQPQAFARLGEAVAYLRGAGEHDLADEVLRYWNEVGGWTDKTGKGRKKWVEEGKKPRYQISKPGEGRKAGATPTPTPTPTPPAGAAPRRPPAPKAPKAPKATAEQVVMALDALRANPNATAEQHDAVLAQLGTLTVPELKKVKAEWDVKVGSRALRPELVREITARAKEMVASQLKAEAEEAPASSADHQHSIAMAIGNAPVASIGDLKASLASDMGGSDQFDQTVLAMADAGLVHIWQDNDPSRYTDAEKKALVRDGGAVFSAIALTDKGRSALAAQPKAPPAAPEAPAPGAEAPAPGAEAPKPEHVAKVASAFDALDRAGADGQVSLVDLARKTGLSVPDLHATVQQMVQSGEWSLAGHEGRHGTSKEQQAHGIPSGDTLLLYLQRRRKEAPAPTPASPRPDVERLKGLWDRALDPTLSSVAWTKELEAIDGMAKADLADLFTHFYGRPPQKSMTGDEIAKKIKFHIDDRRGSFQRNTEGKYDPGRPNWKWDRWKAEVADGGMSPEKVREQARTHFRQTGAFPKGDPQMIDVALDRGIIDAAEHARLKKAARGVALSGKDKDALANRFADAAFEYVQQPGAPAAAAPAPAAPSPAHAKLREALATRGADLDKMAAAARKRNMTPEQFVAALKMSPDSQSGKDAADYYRSLQGQGPAEAPPKAPAPKIAPAPKAQAIEAAAPKRTAGDMLGGFAGVSGAPARRVEALNALPPGQRGGPGSPLRGALADVFAGKALLSEFKGDRLIPTSVLYGELKQHVPNLTPDEFKAELLSWWKDREDVAGKLELHILNELQYMLPGEEELTPRSPSDPATRLYYVYLGEPTSGAAEGAKPAAAPAAHAKLTGLRDELDQLADAHGSADKATREKMFDRFVAAPKEVEQLTASMSANDLASAYKALTGKDISPRARTKEDRRRKVLDAVIEKIDTAFANSI